MPTPSTPDAWYAEQSAWHHELAALRAIALSAELHETLKWKQPCYTDQGRNIFLVSSRKDAAVVAFLEGALLPDPDARLVQPGQDSRSAKYMRFTSVDQVHRDRAYLEALVASAVHVARAGLKVEPLREGIDYVEELQRRLADDPAFARAFEALTPGRRRSYNMHFSRPKNASTRHARITRCAERILMGKGLNDCVCGRSQRMPRCDGSHQRPTEP